MLCAAMMNVTAESVGQVLYQTPVKTLLSLLPCLLFLYINAVMLFVLFRKPLFFQSPRYILFAHFLFTDSLQFLMSIFMYVLAITRVRMISYICMFIFLFAATTVKMSPLNLTVMALERYVAICFPLRHADIVTSRTTSIAIVVMWSVASVDSLTQLLLFVSLETKGFTLSTFCSRPSVFRLKIYSSINLAFVVIYFTIESILISYTYIAIMCTVRSASSNLRDVSRASRTVLLHLLQLCLCLVSTLFTVINSKSRSLALDPDMAIHLQYALFLALIIFPKCLSPLVYGLRDHVLRHVFLYYFTFGLKSSSKSFPKG